MRNIILALFCLAAAGCATRTVLPPLYESVLIVTHSGNEAHIQWESDPHALYTLLYAYDRGPRAEWKPHPDCQRRRGTGEKMTMVDEMPSGRMRYYRLHIEPL